MDDREFVQSESNLDQNPLPRVGAIQPSEIIQAAQMQIGQLQMTYRDADPNFWALALAWETVRLAWYVVEGNFELACHEKLPLVRQALADFEIQIQRQTKTTREPDSDNG